MKKSNRAAIVAAALFFACLLQACGGGGEEGQVQVSSGALPEGMAQSAAIGEVKAITLSQPAVEVEFLKNDDRIEQTQVQTVHIDFQKDNLYIGYAPGAPQVDWLYLPSSKQTLREKSFDLRIEIFPTTHAKGEFSTTLRLVNRQADGTGSTYVDLPVRMKINGLPPIFSGDVNVSTTVGAALASPVVVPLDFGKLPAPVVEVSLVDGNSATSQWLNALVNPDGKSLTLTLKSVTSSGQYKGFVNVRYKVLGTTTDARIPVALQATVTTPKLRHVTPTRFVPGQPADLVLTGEGFSLGEIKRVQVGAVSASRFTRLSDTQVSAHFDALTGSGNQTASITIGERTVQVNNALLLAAEIALPASAINVGESVVEVRYDERTQSMFVATAQRVYRMQLVNEQWVNVASRVMPFQHFELSGDGQQLVFVDTRNITLVDANTLEDAAVRPLPDLSGLPGGYDWVSLLGIMNNGDLLLSLPEGDFSKTYSSKLAVYRFHSGILDVSPYVGSMLMIAQTNRRDRLKMVSNRDWRPTFVGDYVSATDTFEASTLPGVGIYGNRFAMAGDGSQVMLNDVIYNTVTGGQIPVSDAGFYNYYPVLSPDGRRFYAVSEDDRGIGDFAITSTGMTLTATIPSPRDRPTTLWASITPNGQAIFKLGATDVGFNDRRTSVYIIPVR